LTEVGRKFELKLSKSQICLYCKIKSKENRFCRKKVKKRAYSITNQKVNSLVFWWQKCEEYRYRMSITIVFSQAWVQLHLLQCILTIKKCFQ